MTRGRHASSRRLQLSSTLILVVIPPSVRNRCPVLPSIRPNATVSSSPFPEHAPARTSGTPGPRNPASSRDRSTRSRQTATERRVLKNAERVSPTTPATSRQESSAIRRRRPTASVLEPKSRRAALSLTMATRGASGPSRTSNSRPADNGTRSVVKKPSVTFWTGTRSAVSSSVVRVCTISGGPLESNGAAEAVVRRTPGREPSCSASRSKKA